LKKPTLVASCELRVHANSDCRRHSQQSRSWAGEELLARRHGPPETDGHDRPLPELGTVTLKSQGWARERLDPELDIRPDDEGKAAIAEIAHRARRVKRVRAAVSQTESKAT